MFKNFFFTRLTFLQLLKLILKIDIIEKAIVVNLRIKNYIYLFSISSKFRKVLYKILQFKIGKSVFLRSEFKSTYFFSNYFHPYI